MISGRFLITYPKIRFCMPLDLLINYRDATFAKRAVPELDEAMR
jgi:hypothetical protein